MADQADEQRLEKKFWDELESSPFMMLGLPGVDDSFTRPMTAQIADGMIWFFADRSEDLVKGLQQSSRAVATYASKGHDLFASVHGTLVLDNNPEMIDQLWSPAIASWFEGGKDDPKLALIRLDAESADVWLASAGASLKASVIKLLGRDPGEQEQDRNRAEVTL
jgi:general stress protein 26